jgi:class 3 adenylate cyclase
MDLQESDSAERLERFRTAKAFFNNGEFFRSYDLAIEAADHWPDDVRFAHLAVLSLANAGAVDLAIERFAALRLDACGDIDACSLLARLKKDQGFAASGEERVKILREASTIYEQAYAKARAEENPEAYYPGINVAATALWTGDLAKAQQISREVLETLEPRLNGPATGDRYWLQATALEAQLILGDLESAERLAAEVLAKGAGQYAQLATTGRQLRRIADSLKISPAFLKRFSAPAVIHYSGHIISAPGKKGRFESHEEAGVKQKIEELLELHSVGSGYGSLAAGADILFAEALLARGAVLHIVLPFAIPHFLERSVETAGEGWVERFHACLNAAKTVRYATEDTFLDDESLFSYSSQLAMGLAVLSARHMQAPILQIALWDGEARSGIAGTVADMKTWWATKLPQVLIRCGSRPEDEDFTAYEPPAIPAGAIRKVCAMFFGDVHGFSKLDDQELPVFATQIMGVVGKATRRYRKDVAFVNTWGDGVFAVFPDVVRAALWALELQDAMHEMDFAALGLPTTLQLRLGGHLGPAYELLDPVVERMNYYGAHVSRAARIEPITPEGCVYVTETFAAALALQGPTEFTCEYVGYTEMAKHYGRLRMFLLRKTANSAGPTVLSDIERAPLEL